MNPIDITKQKQEFITRFKSCTAGRPGADELLAYLETTDFFTAPSSVAYHSNCAGGLVYHTLLVDDCLTKIYNAFRDNKVHVQDERSLHVAALLHDVCKANFYVKGTRNVKDKLTGKWVEKRVYEIKEEFPVGHGEKSVILVMKHMQLTDEEIMAMRWHMGAFDTSVKGGDRGMNTAYEKYPLVTLLQLADLMAAHIYEETIE